MRKNRKPKLSHKIRMRLRRFADKIGELDNLIIAKAFKEGIDSFLWMASLNPESTYLKVQFTFGFIFHIKPKGKITKLRRWYRNPPDDAPSIKRFIEDIHPDKVCLILGTGITLGVKGVVETGALWNTPEFLEIFNKIKRRR